MKSVAVHDGSFHADEVFAVAMLKIIYPQIEIIRTRDKKIFQTVDARVDVGGAYNPQTNDYDHHQRGGAATRPNGIPYASAGLIWKHFGPKIATEESVHKDIDEKIVQFIDAHDVGIKTYEEKLISPYTISDVVHTLNPAWPNGRNESNTAFTQAVGIAQTIISNEVERGLNKIQANEQVREMLKSSQGPAFIMEKFVPWKDVVIEETDKLFVVFPDSDSDRWILATVPKAKKTFENRKDLPKDWAGLRDEELQQATGVSDALFCHNALFIATAGSKEGILALLKLALESNE